MTRKEAARTMRAGTVVCAALLAVGPAAMVLEPALGTVQKGFEDATFITCDGTFPDGRGVRAEMFHILSTQNGNLDGVVFTLSDVGGATLAQGYAFDEPDMWTDTHFGASTTLYRDWVEPVGQAAISLDFIVLDDATTVHDRGHVGTYTSVFRGTHRTVTVPSVALTVDGVSASSLSCAGDWFHADIIQSYPEWFVDRQLGYLIDWCGSNNAEGFTLLGDESGTRLGFTFAYADAPGTTATSPLLTLLSGRWDGQVTLTVNGEAAGQEAAWATLEKTGPTERTGEEVWPGYVLEWTTTPMLLTVHAEGPNGPVDASCALKKYTLRTRILNG